MRILCCGDQHITNKRPKNRIDNYFETVLRKFRTEMEIAKEECCEFVILPGDVFNTFKENHLTVQKVMDIIDAFPSITILCVAGQHDQQFHNESLEGTALQTLIISGYVKLLTKNPDPFISKDRKVHFYGASWNEEIPEIEDEKAINVLVIHKMIIEEKLWAEQEGHTWAQHLLRKTKFDLIVSGDNHTEFIVNHKQRYLINLGSMMRSTITQVDHHPSVIVYDVDKRTIDHIDLGCKPIDVVMSIDKAMKEKEKNAQLDAFIESLKTEKEDYKTKLSFIDKLRSYIELNQIDEGVSSLIFEAMEHENTK